MLKMQIRRINVFVLIFTATIRTLVRLKIIIGGTTYIHRTYSTVLCTPCYYCYRFIKTITSANLSPYHKPKQKVEYDNVYFQCTLSALVVYEYKKNNDFVCTYYLPALTTCSRGEKFNRRTRISLSTLFITVGNLESTLCVVLSEMMSK